VQKLKKSSGAKGLRKLALLVQGNQHAVKILYIALLEYPDVLSGKWELHP
jgi:hypothetical protein